MPASPLVEIPDWYNRIFDDYCLEVGRLTALWAALERSVDELIWELMDVSAFYGMCVTSQMIGPGPRVRALLSLVQARRADKELSAEFQQFGTLIQKLGGKRNRYAHDTVTLGTTTGVIRTNEITADRVLRYRRNQADINKIRRLWIDIRQAQEDLAHLRALLVEQLPAWTRTHYERSLESKPPQIHDRDSDG